MTTLAIFVILGLARAAELCWDEETSGSTGTENYIVVTSPEDVTALGVANQGAGEVKAAIAAALAGKPPGTKVRILLGKITEGSSRWQFHYLRSIVLLDSEGRPDGVERLVLHQSLTSIESYRIIPWRNGVKDGVEKTFQSDPRNERAVILREEVPWKDGKMDGWRRTYFTDGKVAAETLYVNGVANGPTRVYGPDGNLLREGMMKNGKRDGVMTEYWESSKTPKRVVRYRDGSVDGPVTEYYQSGKIKRKVSIKNEAYHGEERLYNEDGKVVQTRYWIDGKVVTEEEFKKREK